jgi:prevent-host-death family protein
MSTPARTPRKSVQPTSLPLAKVKATLSAVVDGVEQKRIPVTILRRGVPVAQIIPFPDAPAPPLYGSMQGTARELRDIVNFRSPEWTLSKDWDKSVD